MVGPLVQFPVAEQHVDPWLPPALGAEPERHADAQTEPMAERTGGDLHPCYQRPVWMVAQPAPRAREVVQPLHREESLGREYRIVRVWAATFGDREAG